MANALDVIAQYRQPLEDTLETVFAEYEASIPAISSHGAWSLTALKDFSKNPSKRIRGSLAVAMFDHATGSSGVTAGLRLGAAVELLQNYLLIIDDVMDHSAIRRGKPTIHKSYSRQYNTKDGHEANMAAIQVGLLAQHCANMALLNASGSAERIQHALQAIHTHISVTGLGQIDDMHQQIIHMPISEAELLQKYHQKSSYYSFVNPLQSALFLAGSEPEAAKKDSEAYGIPAGIAFQLRDDYLGIFGDSDETGKPNLDDIREGKYTVMMHYALESSSEVQKQKLLSIVGSPSANITDVEVVRIILHDTGSVERAMDDAERYSSEATHAAQSANSWDAAFGSFLSSLVEFSVERTR